MMMKGGEGVDGFDVQMASPVEKKILHRYSRKSDVRFLLTKKLLIGGRDDERGR